MRDQRASSEKNPIYASDHCGFLFNLGTLKNAINAANARAGLQ
jgi:hypothetical protein